ncbi:MAG: type II toxin-antitoxin system VapC family toxin [Alphaproteobacteria bacterium]|nr:type II toxin-antitoxin system VapC family toxin [Alphaproteobacteria bacterium]
MNVYLDASVAVSATHRDALHERAKAALGTLDDTPAMSTWVVAEFTSAATRLFRRGVVDHVGLDEMYDKFRELTEAAIMIQVVDDDIMEAARIVKASIGGMRAPDALHLAICKRLSLPILTFDQRMAGGARSIGLTAIE